MPGTESLAVPNKHSPVLRAGFALQMLTILFPPVLLNAPVAFLLLSVFPRLHKVNYSGFMCPTCSSTCHHAFSAVELLPEIPQPPVFGYRPRLI